jgi:hypothetical protein
MPYNNYFDAKLITEITKLFNLLEIKIPPLSQFYDDDDPVEYFDNLFWSIHSFHNVDSGEEPKLLGCITADIQNNTLGSVFENILNPVLIHEEYHGFSDAWTSHTLVFAWDFGEKKKAFLHRYYYDCDYHIIDTYDLIVCEPKTFNSQQEENDFYLNEFGWTKEIEEKIKQYLKNFL